MPDEFTFNNFNSSVGANLVYGSNNAENSGAIAIEAYKITIEELKAQNGYLRMQLDKLMDIVAQK
jgi:hypothetical protein